MYKFSELKSKISLKPPEDFGTRKMGEMKAGCQGTLYMAPLRASSPTSARSSGDAEFPLV